MRAKASPTPRSGCPVSISLERFGDRWSLLIIRDLMVRGLRTFKEFQESGEGIATNILSSRLDTLLATGIIVSEADASDRRRVNYRLTQKGIDLAPVLLELLIWGAMYEDTGAPCELIAHMAQHRDDVLAEARRRWRERDPTPLLPPFRKGRVRREATRARPRGRLPHAPRGPETATDGDRDRTAVPHTTSKWRRENRHE